MSPRLLAYAIAAVVFAVDQVTKLAIRQEVSTWDSYRVIPGFFNIVHTENPGAAFSLFSDAQPLWRNFILVGLSLGALVLISVLLWRQGARASEGRSMRLGLALILGGALGNVYDRIVHRAVTDFIELYIRSFHWPAFNIADSAITVGACLVLMEMLLTRHSVTEKINAP